MGRVNPKLGLGSKAMDAEWHSFRDEINDSRRMVSGMREEITRLRLENERLRLESSLVHVEDAFVPKWEPREDGQEQEHPTHKTYKELSIGDVLLCHDAGAMYMVVASPESRNRGKHLLYDNRWSVICVGGDNEGYKTIGFVYQGEDSDFKKVELVDYAIIETGDVKKVNDVKVGEAFIHAENGLVYMVCDKNSVILAVTFDGHVALLASELCMDDHVSMVRLELTRRGA